MFEQFLLHSFNMAIRRLPIFSPRQGSHKVIPPPPSPRGLCTSQGGKLPSEKSCLLGKPGGAQVPEWKSLAIRLRIFCRKFSLSPILLICMAHSASESVGGPGALGGAWFLRAFFPGISASGLGVLRLQTLRGVLSPQSELQPRLGS